MPFKLIGCLLVVCTGTMIGFVLSGRLYKRRDFLKSFTEFISLLATNLRYSGDDIFTLVNSCAENSSLDLLLFSECDRPFDELWLERVKRLSSEIPLSKSDISMLNDFGGQLGKTDTEGQLKHLELYEVSFSKQLSSARDAITKNQSYIKQWDFCRKCNRPYDDLEVVMDVELIFKIAAVGIIVAVLTQLLIRSGREEQAMLTSLAGLIVVLTLIITQISTLFNTINSFSVFNMNILSISVLAVVTVIICVMLKPKNAEISVMLGISCSVIILIGVLTQVSAIVTTINQIIASSGISIDYIVILLKSIGICLVTEFAVNTCKDSGSQSLASNVSLAGKIMVTVTALPLYSDILKTVLSLAGN